MTTRSVSIKNLRANIAKELDDLPLIVTKRKQNIALIVPVLDILVETEDADADDRLIVGLIDDSEKEPEPDEDGCLSGT